MHLFVLKFMVSPSWLSNRWILSSTLALSWRCLGAESFLQDTGMVSVLDLLHGGTKMIASNRLIKLAAPIPAHQFLHYSLNNHGYLIALGTSSQTPTNASRGQHVWWTINSWPRINKVHPLQQDIRAKGVREALQQWRAQMPDHQEAALVWFGKEAYCKQSASQQGWKEEGASSQ